MKVFVVLAAAATVAACASVSDVVPTGPDTYMVSAHGVMGYWSGGEQKAKAFERANAFCAAKGKTMQAVNVADTPSGFGRIASGDVEFRCL